jgi:hypothetical protein
MYDISRLRVKGEILKVEFWQFVGSLQSVNRVRVSQKEGKVLMV